MASDPEIAVPEICSVINSFSKVSDYRINCAKSEAIPLSSVCPPAIRANWQFRWMPEGIMYLGMRLTQGLKKIMVTNSILQNIQTMLQNWARMNISPLG